MAPETPLLFMGQEWAAGTPFLYFTDHHDELGRLVTEGRREEFRHFAAFSDPIARARIPDPQAWSTFLASRLSWDERLAEPHASTLKLYQAVLALRRSVPAFHDPAAFHVAALDDATIAIRRDGPHDSFLVVVRLRGAGVVDVTPALGAGQGDRTGATGRWLPMLTSEDPAFSPDPSPPAFEDAIGAPVVRFARPSAVILQCEAERKAR